MVEGHVGDNPVEVRIFSPALKNPDFDQGFLMPLTLPAILKTNVASRYKKTPVCRRPEFLLFEWQLGID